MFEPGGPTLVQLIQQALSSTRGGYDRLAPRFDHTPFRTPSALLDAVANHLGVVDGDALDVCCGTGAGTSMLRQVATKRVVGVDFSAGMLEVARRSVPEAEFVHGDARCLAFDQAFDVVVSFGAFGHITVPEQPAFLEGIYRALRPGGRFVFVTSALPVSPNRTVLVYRAFNAVMRVRNRLRKPAFVMYYLNFLLPEATERLLQAGFEVHHTRIDAGPFQHAVIVEARRPA